MKKRNINLTEGNPLTLILLFAFPIFLGNLFQIFYSLIDTKIVGSILGEEALAAVGSVSTLYNLLVGFFNGLTLGFSVLTARYFGAKDEERLKRSVGATILLGYGIALVLVIAVRLMLGMMLQLLHVPQLQMDMAYSYISILIWGMFITLGYNICANLLRAIGDSVTPLIFLIISAILNIGMDYFFILVLKQGVAGAAMATVLAQLISVVLCLIHIKRSFEILKIKKIHLRLRWEEVKPMLASGFSMGMMSSLVNAGTLILQSAINTFGTTIIVAHTAARKVFEIWNLPVSVLGASMATYCSQNYGAGKYDRIRKGVKMTLAIALGWCVIVIIMAHTIGTYLIGFIASTQSEEILYWGSTYLKVDMSFLMVCALIVVLRNTLQGIGDYTTPIVSSLIELAGKIMFTFIFVKSYGYWGVIWTEPVIWILMVIPLVIMIVRHPVMRKKK